jgi:hypothetical protein
MTNLEDNCKGWFQWMGKRTFSINKEQKKERSNKKFRGLLWHTQNYNDIVTKSSEY